MNQEAYPFLELAADISRDIKAQLKPPSESQPFSDDPVVLIALVKNTRTYIERVAHQANGAYANGWYDASAVMLRRLLETLVIECFEKHGISSKIKDKDGNFFFLRDLVGAATSEPSWNLGRNAKSALVKLKDLGDKSAHNRRFNAHREDIERLVPSIRDVVQELISLAELQSKR